MQWPPIPGPGIERHEAERLCRRRTHNLPRIDAKRVAKTSHLVRHSDIDRTKRVLPKLARLRDAGRRNGVNII